MFISPTDYALKKDQVGKIPSSGHPCSILITGNTFLTLFNQLAASAFTQAIVLVSKSSAT